MAYGGRWKELRIQASRLGAFYSMCFPLISAVEVYRGKE